MADCIEILSASSSHYELLDSGNKLKLERFGDVITVRSEPKAWWQPSQPELWKRADCTFVEGDKKGWRFNSRKIAPVLDFDGVKFCTKFMDGTKHLGVFPEQLPHWRFIINSVKNQKTSNNPKLLNLFGYTGAASLFAAKAGFEVTHVDASKPSVDWARKNQEVSGLSECKIRWIVDDALKYVKREERRGVKYDAIVLDPPAFGRGPKGELWKLEKMLPQLLEGCRNVLSNKPMFVLITLYSIEASSVMAGNMLTEYFGDIANFSLSQGELILESKKGYNLPLSIWAKCQF
ncbi:MAG: oxidoreductase [Verrucomicrobiaceae bacterium]|nr:oxidoreductase [Verrucomicrobiaceae bacterium]